MKLALRDRILLLIYTTLGCISAFVVVALGLATEWMKPGIQSWIYAISGNFFFRLLIIVFGVAWLMYSAWLLYLTIRVKKYMQGERTVAIKDSESGTIRVSVTALDSMVQKCLKQTAGILSVRTAIMPEDEMVGIKLNMSVQGDVIIPEITLDIQRRVKAYIEKHAGIAISDVEVLVEEVGKGEGLIKQLKPEKAAPIVEDAPVEVEVEAVTQDEVITKEPVAIGDTPDEQN